MGKCKDCKYIVKEEVRKGKQLYSCGCEKIKYNYDFEEMKDDELFYTDSETYQAYMRVGKEFGCIHFKEKQNE